MFLKLLFFFVLSFIWINVFVVRGNRVSFKVIKIIEKRKQNRKRNFISQQTSRGKTYTRTHRIIYDKISHHHQHHILHTERHTRIWPRHGMASLCPLWVKWPHKLFICALNGAERNIYLISIFWFGCFLLCCSMIIITYDGFWLFDVFLLDNFIDIAGT